MSDVIIAIGKKSHPSGTPSESASALSSNPSQMSNVSGTPSSSESRGVIVMV